MRASADRLVKPTSFIGDQGVDEQGSPLVRLDGCPNCGRGAGWMDPITYFGMRNVGLDPDGACSRACELQAEYARALRTAAS
jgi:ferredoxin